MGFLDDVVSLFTGDLFYPDNPKRADRFCELQRDCETFLRQEKELSVRLTAGISELDARLRRTFESIRRPELLQPGSVSLPRSYQPLPRLLLPLVRSDPVCDACNLGAGLVSGAPGDVLETALGMRITLINGDWIFGVPSNVLVFGPALGARRRENLRSAIRGSAAARFRIRLLLEAEDKLMRGVEAVNTVLAAVKKTEVDWDAVIQGIIPQIEILQEEIDALAPCVRSWLDNYDKFRSSWTAEG